MCDHNCCQDYYVLIITIIIIGIIARSELVSIILAYFGTSSDCNCCQARTILDFFIFHFLSVVPAQQTLQCLQRCQRQRNQDQGNVKGI